MRIILASAAVLPSLPAIIPAGVIMGAILLTVWLARQCVRLSRLAVSHPRIAGLALLGILSHVQLLAVIATIVYLAICYPAVLAFAALVWPLALIAILTRQQWQLSEETQARVIETACTIIDLAPVAYVAYRAVVDYFRGIAREVAKRCRLCYRYTRYCLWIRRDVFGMLAIGIAAHVYAYAAIAAVAYFAPVSSAVVLSLASAVVVCIAVRPVRSYLWSQVERDGIAACVVVCVPIACRFVAGVCRDLSRLIRAYWTRDYSAVAVYASPIRHYRPQIYVPCRAGWTFAPAALSTSLIADALADRSAEYLWDIVSRYPAESGQTVRSADEILHALRSEATRRKAESN